MPNGGSTELDSVAAVARKGKVRAAAICKARSFAAMKATKILGRQMLLIGAG